MFTLAKSWMWVKEHWKVFAFFVWSMLVWVISRKNSMAALEVLEARKESYDKQLALLKRNHKKELTEKDKLIIEYHDTIDKLEEKFKNEHREITKEHKKEIKKIVEISRGNPEEIKKRIEEEFGFEFIG